MKKKIIFIILYVLASLPLIFLYILSDFFFLIICYILRYRRNVIMMNLREAFPEKTEKEIKKIAKSYYRFLCDVMVETVKLFHISDKELRKRVEVINPEIVNKALIEGKNAVILMGHYGNWEWVQEISRYFISGVYLASIYHTLTSQFWNDLYLKIRSRWGVNIIPQKKALRQLIDKSHRPWACGFIADQRTWDRHEDNCTRFLNHDTYFIYGPEEIGDKLGSEFFYLEMTKIKRGKYRIKFHCLTGEGYDSPFPRTRQFWHEFEKTIKKDPALWLWSHRRWV